MGKILLVLMIITVLLTGGCGMQQAVLMERPTDDVLTSFQPEMVHAHNRFGFTVYRALPDSQDNVLVSPISLSMAFAMALNGADSETEAEMSTLMGLADYDREDINRHLLALLYFLRTADAEVVLDVSNSAWMKEGVLFEEEYVQRLKEYLLARAETLDFADPEAADTINEWVKQQTRGMIPTVVEPPIDPLTILYLINAVYFDGNWTSQFNQDLTSDEVFANLSGTKTQVPMMNQTGSMLYYENETMQIIRIPYGQEKRIAMNVILPRDSAQWDEFLAGWDAEAWSGWRSQLTEQEGILTLPRFEFSFETSLVDTLQALGLRQAFHGDMADFSRMVDPSLYEGLHISDVIHKTRIRVSEEGTEAAAVTSIEMGVTSVPAHDFTMRVDRPFLFLIEDEDTGAVVFLGHVTSL
jgi:serine protease inhibitor